MAQSYFIWNGEDSRNHSIIMRHAAPIIRPEERVQHVTIPGMSGDLTQIEGDDIYNSYIQTLEISVKSPIAVHQAYKWLRGSGYITFSGQPFRMQPARVIGAVTLNKVSRNMPHWAGTVQFYCQPLKQALTETPATLSASGIVSNIGDVPSYPIIYVYPNADQSYVDVTVNGQTLRLTNIRGARRIDCRAKQVTNALQTVLVTQNSAGVFPVLQVGENTIGGSGWATLEIYKQERYL